MSFVGSDEPLNVSVETNTADDGRASLNELRALVGKLEAS